MATSGQRFADETSPFDAVPCAPGERQLLFRTQSDGAVVHLFGSIHFGRDSFYPFDAPIETAFEGSERDRVAAAIPIGRIATSSWDEPGRAAADTRGRVDYSHARRRGVRYLGRRWSRSGRDARHAVSSQRE